MYGLSEEGAALVGSLDLRQTRGDPGFFGSYGFKFWAGVGEAKPIGVMHELGHSYWGGFPVEGSPGLSWDVPSGQKLSPALQSYHSDVLAFMAQPPDGFEVLRQRLRNLPKLSSANPEPLIHTWTFAHTTLPAGRIWAACPWQATGNCWVGKSGRDYSIWPISSICWWETLRRRRILDSGEATFGTR